MSVCMHKKHPVSYIMIRVHVQVAYVCVCVFCVCMHNCLHLICFFRLLVVADSFASTVRLSSSSSELHPFSLVTPKLAVRVDVLPTRTEQSSADNNQLAALQFSVAHNGIDIVSGLLSGYPNYTLYALPSDIARTCNATSCSSGIRINVISFAGEMFFPSTRNTSGSVISINVTADGRKIAKLRQPLTFWQPGQVC